MCVDHDDSIHGKYWSEVQTEVFNNRFEEGADCDLGDPANAFPICSDEASGVSSTISERKRRLYKRRYDRLCAQGLPEASEGCCIKRVNGKLMGVYGEATLPCLEERDIPGHTCQAMEWADRKHCICNLITGRMPIPECSVDSHCPAGKKCCWTKNGDDCTMACAWSNITLKSGHMFEARAVFWFVALTIPIIVISKGILDLSQKQQLAWRLSV